MDPPYWDAILGVYAQGIWLFRHHLNYALLLQEPSYIDGGAKVHLFYGLSLLFAILKYGLASSYVFLMPSYSGARRSQPLRDRLLPNSELTPVAALGIFVGGRRRRQSDLVGAIGFALPRNPIERAAQCIPLLFLGRTLWASGPLLRIGLLHQECGNASSRRVCGLRGGTVDTARLSARVFSDGLDVSLSIDSGTRHDAPGPRGGR